jgi:hypothetical protein
MYDIYFRRDYCLSVPDVSDVIEKYSYTYVLFAVVEKKSTFVTLNLEICL